jgi:hypothetical protein
MYPSIWTNVPGGPLSGVRLIHAPPGVGVGGWVSLGVGLAGWVGGKLGVGGICVLVAGIEVGLVEVGIQAVMPNERITKIENVFKRFILGLLKKVYWINFTQRDWLFCANGGFEIKPRLECEVQSPRQGRYEAL